MDKHCRECKYFGEIINNHDLHSCNNEKSLYKACFQSATACEQFKDKKLSQHKRTYHKGYALEL